VLPNPVQKNMQAEILSSLHEHCVCFYRKMFGKKEDETEEERTKRWSTFNDTLRKMVLGTYFGAKLPSYFRLQFNLIESPQWKSFFIQRVLVFHGAGPTSACSSRLLLLHLGSSRLFLFRLGRRSLLLRLGKESCLPIRLGKKSMLLLRPLRLGIRTLT
jgi:hypothetical protein